MSELRHENRQKKSYFGDFESLTVNDGLAHHLALERGLQIVAMDQPGDGALDIRAGADAGFMAGAGGGRGNGAFLAGPAASCRSAELSGD
jgi:hypothetical protein